MDLADLRIFRAVVEEGGITRAAEKLHRVQSNVTTRVKQLETDLGTQLFVRRGKRLHLAPAGQVLLGYADKLLGLAEEARAAVQDSRPGGLFRLGAMESTAAVRLPQPLTALFQRFPDVDLQLRTGNPGQLAAAILNDELDAAFVTEPVPTGPFDQVVAFEEPLVLVTEKTHPAIGPKSAPPNTVLVFEPGCPHRQRLDAWFAERQEMARQTIEMGSYHAMLACVVVGMGAALLPKSVLETFPERHLIRTHKLPKGLDRAATLLIWRKDAASANVVALRDVLAAA